ncbi:hypothetical protein [Halarcobacter sp.]|uniref:hypothetical protein n=1 Tax=Halarcobacter sp. TaxID=2321133 RepID=UPI003A91C98C
MDSYASMLENSNLINTNNKNFIFLNKIDKYEFYLHRELDEFDYLETEVVVMKLSESKSKVVFYDPNLDNICLFIHKGINSFYDVNINEINLAKYKHSYNEMIECDINELLSEVETNHEEIKRIAENY